MVVTSVCVLAELDQNLPIDLESTVAGQLLLDQVASDSSTFRLTEVLPEPSETGYRQGREHLLPIRDLAGVETSRWRDPTTS